LRRLSLLDPEVNVRLHSGGIRTVESEIGDGRKSTGGVMHEGRRVRLGPPAETIAPESYGAEIAVTEIDAPGGTRRVCVPSPSPRA
jgi:hypothetical protein